MSKDVERQVNRNLSCHTILGGVTNNSQHVPAHLDGHHGPNHWVLRDLTGWSRFANTIGAVIGIWIGITNRQDEVGVTVKISRRYIFGGDTASRFTIQLVTDSRSTVKATGPAARSLSNTDRSK